MKSKSNNTDRRLDDIVRVNNVEHRRPARCESYQWKLLEGTMNPLYWEMREKFVPNLAEMENRLHNDEQLFALSEQLKQEYHRIIIENASDRQFQIIKMVMSGMTQNEIAHELGLQQSTIMKSLQGNLAYGKRNVKYWGKHWGGANKMLRAVAAADPKVQQLKEQIRERVEELTS